MTMSPEIENKIINFCKNNDISQYSVSDVYNQMVSCAIPDEEADHILDILFQLHKNGVLVQEIVNA